MSKNLYWNFSAYIKNMMSYFTLVCTESFSRWKCQPPSVDPKPKPYTKKHPFVQSCQPVTFWLLSMLPDLINFCTNEIILHLNLSFISVKMIMKVSWYCICPKTSSWEASPYHVAETWQIAACIKNMSCQHCTSFTCADISCHLQDRLSVPGNRCNTSGCWESLCSFHTVVSREEMYHTVQYMPFSSFHLYTHVHCRNYSPDLWLYKDFQ